jgi:WD40 repeat protein
MSDIFISYSRKDNAFVHRLHKALATENREAWVDWEGILPSAEWIQEITTAIEEADAFIFVITPDSVNSKVCQRELSIAVVHNKRLIPIALRDVDNEKVPESLAKLNWIHFRHTDNFAKSFDALIKAIDTDLDYVRAHTHILTKSLDWERKSEDRSLLLRGRDLKDAEEWLSASGTKTPASTALQTQFILTSRKRQTKQLRVFLLAAALAIVLLAGTTILATYQKQLAQKRYDIIQARQLAKQAELNLTSFPQRSLLLAVESNNRKSSGTRKTIPVAENTLRNIISATGAIPLSGHQGPIWAVAVDPKNRWLATGSGDKTVRLWDLARLKSAYRILEVKLNELTSLTFGPNGNWLAGLDAYGAVQLWNLQDIDAHPIMTGENGYSESSSQFSPDGTHLIFANGEKNIRLLNLKNPTAKPRKLQLDGRINAYAFDSESDWLATLSGQKNVWLWKITDPLSRPVVLKINQTLIDRIVFHPAKPWLVGVGSTGNLHIWDLTDVTAAPKIFQLNQSPKSWSSAIPKSEAAVFSPDGNWLIASGKYGQELWDMNQTTPQQVTLPAHQENPFYDQEQSSYVNKTHILFSKDSEWLAILDESWLRLWQLTDAEPKARDLPENVPISRIVFDVGYGLWLAAADENNNVHIWQLSYWGIGHEIFRGHEGQVTSLAFSGNGKWLASGSWDRTARLWNLTKSDPNTDPFESPLFGEYSAIDYQGRKLATVVGPKVQLWDLSQTLEEMKVLQEYPFKNVSAVRFSPTGRWLFTQAIDGDLNRWDLRVPEPKPLKLKQIDERASVLDISANDRYLVADLSGQSLWLWDLDDTSANPEKLIEKTIQRNLVKFGPVGHWLAMADGSHSIRLWDMENRQRNPFDLGNTGLRLKTFAFNPQKSQIAAGSWDGQVLIWNLNDTASDPKEFTGHQGEVTTMAFSMDGRWLGTGSIDGTIRLWNTDDPAEPVELQGDEVRTSAIAFDFSNSFVASLSEKGNLRIWDLHNVEFEPIILHGHDGPVDAVSFDPEGRWIFTHTDHKVKKLWRLSLERLKDIACLTAGRNLNCAEWRQFLTDEPYRATCPELPAPLTCDSIN